jgi:hypothetical protein
MPNPLSLEAVLETGYLSFPDVLIFHSCSLGWGGVNWIDLAQDRNRWRILVNVVMNVQVL